MVQEIDQRSIVLSCSIKKLFGIDLPFPRTPLQVFFVKFMEYLEKLLDRTNANNCFYRGQDR